MTKRMASFLILAALLLTATWAVCQQVKRTRNAAITAQNMELDWDKGVIEFTGNCRLVVGGDYEGTMTAPSMKVELTPKHDKIHYLVAKGPVSFTIVTRPDAKGARRKIVASAQQEANYSEETQLVKLIGGAKADMMPVGSTDPDEVVHFTGQTITANLKTNRLLVDDANLTVQSQLQ
jgi:lipopolysaccharide export system protein LptA